MFKKNWSVYIGVFLVSLSILALEVIINRMFALTFWYHFAFIILSIALFGIGFGGLLVFFTNRFVKKFVPVVLAIVSIGLAFSIPYVLLQINSIPLEMNHIADSPEEQELFKNFFLTLIIPFVLGGYVFSSLFSNFSDDINRIYFFDLLGGGIGCFFALMIFPHNGPMITAVVISGVVIVAAAFFAFKQHFILSIPVLLLLVVLGYFVYPSLKDVNVRVSKEKRNVEAIGVKEFSDWDNFGYVAVHDRAQKGSKAVTADYSCFTYLFPVKNNKDLSVFKSFLSSHYYPYVIKKDPVDVGIIGVGAGKDVLLALGSGAKNVYGAEFNSTIYRIFNNVYNDFLGGVAHLSNVHVQFEEGRFFIRSSPRKYDVLVFDNSISQVAVSSGSFTLAESYLFTVEGMMDYINHLKPGGVIYLSNPYTDAYRFTTLIREAFHRLGRDKDFMDSIIVAEEPSESYRKCKVLIKNGSFTKEENDRILQFINSEKHKLLYSPYVRTSSYVERLVKSEDLQKEYLTFETELRPSTDDWPYFSQHVKPTDESFTGRIYAVKAFYPQPFLLLRQITKQVALYSVLFLLLPLLFLNLGGLRKLPNKTGSLIYFSSLGLGFMLMEVVMMQKYTLILGHPVYSFSIVLSSLLISSGIGSFLSKFIKNAYRAIITALCGIILTTVLSYFIVLIFESQLVGLTLLLRSIIVISLISITGVFMGFMMPSGIRAISSIESAIPWMWSVNGIFSVVASFITVYVSILYGYTIVFVLGLLVYALGSLVFAFRMKLRE